MTTVSSESRVGGMLVGYYIVCPRKAWLSMRGIWMEQESEVVLLGRLLDQHSYDRADKHLTVEAELPGYGTAADSPGVVRLIGKIDRANLRDGVLLETKKGRSCEAAHHWQLRFYLWLLRLNGVNGPGGAPFTGRLDYPLLRKSEAVVLTADHEHQLAGYVRALYTLAEQDAPPDRLARRSFCTKCAYEELCYG